MYIAGLQKLTLVDYPGRMAATVFTPGCNFACPFCHNASLVAAGGSEADRIPEEDFFAFLEKRHGLLDGVCVTGGEPLLQPGIADFCTRVKDAGFAVKLDTNGSLPTALTRLLGTGLVDYVAMDVKNTPARYGKTIGVAGFDAAPILESMRILARSGVPHEFRTTVCRELHSPEGLEELAAWIANVAAPTCTWWLQDFRDGDTVLGGEGLLSPYAEEDLTAMLPTLRAHVPNTHIRGAEER